MAWSRSTFWAAKARERTRGLKVPEGGVRLHPSLCVCAAQVVSGRQRMIANINEFE